MFDLRPNPSSPGAAPKASDEKLPDDAGARRPFVPPRLRKEMSLTDGTADQRVTWGGGMGS